MPQLRLRRARTVWPVSTTPMRELAPSRLVWTVAREDTVMQPRICAHNAIRENGAIQWLPTRQVHARTALQGHSAQRRVQHRSLLVKGVLRVDSQQRWRPPRMQRAQHACKVLIPRLRHRHVFLVAKALGRSRQRRPQMCALTAFTKLGARMVCASRAAQAIQLPNSVPG